jgi:Ca2+-binding RTX toxin-like protein
MITPVVLGGQNVEGRLGDGRDVLQGGNQRDFLFGGDEQDILSGGSGNDYMDGGASDDEPWRHGDDVIWRLGRDALNGDAGIDQLYGDGGDDNLPARCGTPGVVKVYGGAGNNPVRYTSTVTGGECAGTSFSAAAKRLPFGNIRKELLATRARLISGDCGRRTSTTSLRTSRAP